MFNVSVSDLKNLFPTKIHLLIFIGYMTLFINQGTEAHHDSMIWACDSLTFDLLCGN